jgi:hypothetical protein
VALKRPPQHRVDAEAIYVHPADEAWDWPRITNDREAMAERGEDPDQHPVSIYLTGRSRYDLHARMKFGSDSAPASDWLDMKSATLFNLRRLEPRDFARIHPRKIRAQETGVEDLEASLDACVAGLRSIDGPDSPKIVGRDRLTDQDVKRIEDRFGPSAPWAIGDAAYFASIPLTDDEKKAFAS